MRLEREHLYYPEFWEWALPKYKSREGLFRKLSAALPDMPRNTISSVSYKHNTIRPVRRPFGWTWAWPAPPYPGHPEIDEIGDQPAVLEAQIAAMQPVAQYPDKKHATVDWREVLFEAQKEADRRETMNPSQDSGTIDFSAWQHPVGVMLMSDVHFGSPQCDYLTFLQHAAMLDTIPNLYAIIQGDICEWAISPRMMDSVLSQVFPPQNQAQVVQAFIDDLSLKVVCAIMGNHGGRAEKTSGFDVGLYMYDAMQRNHTGIYMKDGGSLQFLVGAQSYSWLVMHGDSRFGSMYNANHKAGQLARMSFGRHDIASTGHTHGVSIQHMESPAQDGEQPRQEILLQAGSYKVRGHEQYPHRLGFMLSHRVGMPMAILFPTEKRVLPFAYVEDGVMVLRALNAAAGVKEKAS